MQKHMTKMHNNTIMILCTFSFKQSTHLRESV